MRKIAWIFGTLAVLASAGLAGPAQAATATGSLGVTITILKTCVVGTVAPISFGSQNLLTANVDATGSIAVTCTAGTGYNIGLGVGTGSGATVANRKMTAPSSATVTYQIYSDSGYSQIWGETIGSDTLAGTGSGLVQPISVYGRVAPQSTPGPGLYSDLVAITVTY